jgi:hypothetical protein
MQHGNVTNQHSNAGPNQALKKPAESTRAPIVIEAGPYHRYLRNSLTQFRMFVLSLE